MKYLALPLWEIYQKNIDGIIKVTTDEIQKRTDENMQPKDACSSSVVEVLKEIRGRTICLRQNPCRNYSRMDTDTD